MRLSKAKICEDSASDPTSKLKSEASCTRRGIRHHRRRPPPLKSLSKRETIDPLRIRRHHRTVAVDSRLKVSCSRLALVASLNYCLIPSASRPVPPSGLLLSPPTRFLDQSQIVSPSALDSKDIRLYYLQVSPVHYTAAAMLI